MSLLNHPRLGETMATAAMMAYAYDQIDQARAELNAVSLKIAGRAARQPLDRPEPDRPARDQHSAPAPSTQPNIEATPAAFRAAKRLPLVQPDIYTCLQSLSGNSVA